LRATSAAAAAPNSRTIGGAGTGAGGPPLEPELPDELLELDEDEELDEELLDPVELGGVSQLPLLVEVELDEVLLVPQPGLLPPLLDWFWFWFWFWCWFWF